MKIIHDPQTCPMCEYSREGLEPGRPCPECGLGLFPGAPVLDFGISRRLIRSFVFLGVSAGTVQLVGGIFGMFRSPSSPDWSLYALLCVLGVLCVTVTLSAWMLDPTRLHVVFSLRGIVYLRGGRTRWRLPYDEVAGCTASRTLRAVVLRDASGKRRVIWGLTREEQATVIAAIDDVLGRYRSQGDAE